MKHITIVFLLLIGIALSACANNTAPPPAQSSGPVKEFSIEAYQFGFEPSTITIKKGERVKLTFSSKDVEHGVSLPDFEKVTRKFGKGQTQSVEFVADKSGTFDYMCNVYCGNGHPTMRGQIIVTN